MTPLCTLIGLEGLRVVPGTHSSAGHPIPAGCWCIDGGDLLVHPDSYDRFLALVEQLPRVRR